MNHDATCSSFLFHLHHMFFLEHKRKRALHEIISKWRNKNDKAATLTAKCRRDIRMRMCERREHLPESKINVLDTAREFMDTDLSCHLVDDMDVDDYEWCRLIFSHPQYLNMQLMVMESSLCMHFAHTPHNRLPHKLDKISYGEILELRAIDDLCQHHHNNHLHSRKTRMAFLLCIMKCVRHPHLTKHMLRLGDRLTQLCAGVQKIIAQYLFMQYVSIMY